MRNVVPLWLFCLILPLTAFSQQETLDSLRRAAASQTGKERLATRTRIAAWFNLPDGGSIKLADSVFQEADALGLPDEAAKAVYMHGHILFDEGRFDEALAIYRKGLHYATRKKEILYQGRGISHIAGVYDAKGVPDSTIFYSQQVLAFWQKQDSAPRALHALLYLGDIYSKYLRLADAMQCQTQALEMAKSLQDSAALLSIYGHLGTLAKRLGDADAAKTYFQTAFRIGEKKPAPDIFIPVLVNGGIFFKSLLDYTQAEALYLQALDLIPPAETDRGFFIYYQSNIHHNLGSLYLEWQKYSQARTHAQLCLQFSKEGNLIHLENLALADLARAYTRLGRTDSAMYFLNQTGNGLSRKAYPVQVAAVLRARAEVYAAMGKHAAAYEALNAYLPLQDSIDKAETDLQFGALQARFKSQEQKALIAELEKTNQQAKGRRNLLLALLVLVAAVAGLGINFFYFRARKNKQLLLKNQEVDRLKSRFFANISHELRTPLTLILAPVDTLLGRADAEDKAQLTLIRRHALRLLKLINQLLDLARAEAGRLELKASLGNIIPLAKGLVFSFQSHAERKGIQLRFSSASEVMELYFDREKMEHILINLVGNAVKFTPEGGEVAVKVGFAEGKQGKMVSVEVADTGIGIGPQQLPHIFDRFYQADNSETRAFEGAGIGLALVKELVDLHHGEIRVTSTPGQGSVFQVLLPEGDAHLTEREKLLVPSSAPLSFEQEADLPPLVAEPAAPSAEEKPLVLVVEDHDEVRAYIVSQLAAAYEVRTASDGQEGLEMARELVPDLIISDLMMPRMDGLGLAAAIRTDERTDHIPLILLTARAEEEDRLRGLKVQADEYLTKPFNPRELLLRVDNLVRMRLKMQERFRQQITLKPAQTPVTSMEQAFLEKLKAAVEANLSDEHFDVPQLAEAVSLSRSQLFRKLKALTGETPTTFIRDYRLEHAMHLLSQRAATVTEVAYQVGFNSPTYFSKCFSDRFGVTPGEVAARGKNPRLVQNS